jgi:transcriptional regulator with XRE-family HTH domain
MDDVAACIIDLMEEQRLTQEGLETQMGKHKSYVNRVLSGGVNLTLKTIAEFEEALGATIIEVVPAKQEWLARRRPDRTTPAHIA